MRFAFSLTLALFALSTVQAGAMGTVTIVHANGDRNVYNNVSIEIIHGALYMTSEDGKGTMIIKNAACSHQAQLMVCYATKATLVQSGEVTPLDFKRGTVYLNDTDDYQPLVMSSTKVAPHSIMLSYTTSKGTLVTCMGGIDKVVK